MQAAPRVVSWWPTFIAYFGLGIVVIPVGLFAAFVGLAASGGLLENAPDGARERGSDLAFVSVVALLAAAVGLFALLTRRSRLALVAGAIVTLCPPLLVAIGTVDLSRSDGTTWAAGLIAVAVVGIATMLEARHR